jgi:ferritin
VIASQKIIDAVNEQIGQEFGAMLQYYAIAAHFGAEALPELSEHFYEQAEEEKQHALRFIQFVTDTGARVEIPPALAPQADFKAAEDAVKLSLEQENTVMSQVNALVAMAKAESNYTTENFLHSRSCRCTPRRGPHETLKDRTKRKPSGIFAKSVGSVPAALLPRQIFLSPQQIALACALNNSQQLFH